MSIDQRRRLAPEVRRRQVLDAAVAVFSSEGFHGASMDAVAERAGVSKPSVYAHGGTKEELFGACLAREADRLTTTMAAAADHGAGTGTGTADRPEARLRRALVAFFRAVTTHREGWTVLYRQASAGEFTPIVDAARRTIVLRAAALLATEPGGDTTAVVPLAHVLVGAGEGLAEWWLASEHPDPPDREPAEVLADMLVSVVWPGLDAVRRGVARHPDAPGA